MTRRRDTGLSGTEALDEINARLGGLLGGLGETLSDIVRAVEAGGSEIVREHVIDTPSGPVHARAGVRIRTVAEATGSTPGAAPRAASPRPAASASPRPGDTRPAIREVDIETAVEDGRLVMTADLPGATQDDLTLRREGGLLVIETHGSRRYRGQCAVPDDLDLDAIEIRLSNGILELTGPAAGVGEE